MNKIKWGVLGTAGIAKGQTIPGMQQAENCELTAIAGRSLEKAMQFKTLFGFEKAYGSYEELLNDSEVQAVYIPLPNEMHYEWTIKALKAKKHVLCEKPLAPTVKEAEEMIACAKENGVILMEAFAYLHSPIMSAVKADLEKIGDIRYMESAFMTSDYDVSNIRMRRETFGGGVYDLGCYTTSQILWMMGEEPECVQAVGSFSEQKIDTYATGILTFKNGVRANFACGMLLATDKDKRIDRFQIHGTKGFIASETEFNEAGTLTYTLTTEAGSEVKTVEAPQNYRLEVEQMGRCILSGEPLHVSHEFTLMNLRVIERILKEIGY
ncbi:MAG: Gfo/Idh/MocA family oxidoreductase [Clostridia bacterium]|nr:Gfo/Idh/MocA family oxidoreductase [Clostridia bacterium]